MQLKAIFFVATMLASASAAPGAPPALPMPQGCIRVDNWYGDKKFGCMVHSCPPGTKFLRAMESCWIERQCCFGFCCPT